MIDFRQLEMFCAVVNHGGLSKASRVLFCSQPVLTNQIQKLERELGQDLFDRSKRPMELTQVGKITYTYATRLLKMHGMMHAEIARCDHRAIRIGASSVPNTYLLPQALTQFRKTHPDCSYIIKQGDSTEIVELVSEQVLDFGVVGTIISDQNCTFTRLCEERLVLALPQGYLKRNPHLTTVAHILKRLPLIAREEGSGTFKHGVAALEHLGVELASLQFAARLENQEAICKSIMAGMGCSILSELVVRDHVDAGKMDVFSLGDYAARSFYIVRNAQEPPSSQVVDDLIASLINLYHSDLTE